MRSNHCVFRLTARVVLVALTLEGVLPPLAVGQPAPPPLPQPYRAEPAQPEADPPARVGRVARLAGTVSFRTEGDDQWTVASVNYPVATGNAFWTEPSASAQLEISDSRIALAGTTEFEIATLDSNGLQAVAAQGEAYIHLRDLAAAEVWSVQTPRGLVHLNTQGRYHISVGSTEQPTRITVLDGSAQIDGPGVSLQVARGQTATIDGTNSFEGSVGPMVRDAFLIASVDAERPPPALPPPIPAEVSVLPGGNDLTGYGNWSEAPDYGQVWYPPVSPSWVPYREGHWAYVAPWGWTWIDDAPWGFAPFHYGRWIEIGGRWAWTPGHPIEASPPVYAPALVTFIGVGVGIALGAALASRSIGWVPLGPREPFHPWYQASERYVRNVNVSQVTNINNNITVNNFVNQRAATVMPGSDMARSRPVRAVGQPMTAQQFANAQPIIGQQPIRPTAETAGVTPAVARTFNLSPTTPFRPAPGPALRPGTPGTTGTGFVQPAVVSPGRREPGSPPFRSVGNGSPLQPSHPQVPNLAIPGARPAALPVPQVSEPPRNAPAVNRQGEPNIVRPGGIAPAALPSPAVVVPGSVIHSDPRTQPQVTTPAPQHFMPPPAATPHVAVPGQIQHIEPQHVAPHQETSHFAAPVSRPEPPHPTAPAPMQHVAPHQAPPHFAAPAPRPEPPHPAASAPVVREKRPGER